jgi:integrase
MAKALTAPAVEKLKPGTARREIADARMPGLYLIIQPSGAKSWAVRYRYGRRSRKYTIGSYPAYDLGKARKRASEILQAAGEGLDPARQKLKARAAARAGYSNLFADLAKAFVLKHAKPRNRSWRETARILGVKPVEGKPGEFELLRKAKPGEKGNRRTRDGLATRWAKREVGDISKRDILDELDAFAGVGANRALATLRKFFNWLIERDILTTSPCAGLKAPAPEESRDRVLTDEEIRLLWIATEKVGYPFGPFTRLLLLTGQRREEVAAMMRSELDVAGGLWTIPKERAKNKQPHAVPLSDAALEVIEALPKIAGKPGFLFTHTGVTPISGFSKARRTLMKVMSEAADGADIEHFTFHDLRRTAASGMGKLGVAPHIIEAVLNHRTGVIRGVARVYNRHAYGKEKRAALDVWSKHIVQIVCVRPAGEPGLEAAE